MRQQKKAASRSGGTPAERVGKMESAFKEIEAQLSQTSSHLKAHAERFKELERRVANGITDLEAQVRELRSAGANLNGLINLEEGSAVNLEELEKKMEERCAGLAAKEEELQNLGKRISAEFESLRAEMKERDLLLAAREMEMKGLKQTLGARIEELEHLAKSRPAGAGRTTRLVSFLVDIGKKH